MRDAHARLGLSASTAADQLCDALAGETDEPSEQAVGGPCSVCGPQRRAQPAPGSLELGLSYPDSRERFRDGAQPAGKLR
jgi:hypothetical protein